MTTTILTPGDQQRLAAKRGAAAAIAVAGLLALLAHGSVVPVVVLSVLGAVVVYVRPEGNVPALGFVLVVMAWTFYAPRATAWAVLAAAVLVAAHTLLAVGDATRGGVPLSAPNLARAARRCLIVVVPACVAGLATVIGHTTRDGTHILLGVIAFVVVAGWLAWFQLRPDP